MRLGWLAVALLALGGCGDDTQPSGGVDLGAGAGDLAAADLAPPTTCSPDDPMTDGTPCSAGCPAGTLGVNFGGACGCYQACDTNPECSCNRLCDVITVGDAAVGGACLPGNGPGERCSRDAMTGQPFGHVFCGQLTLCVNADAAKTFRYCNYLCDVQADCPAQTVCLPFTTSTGASGKVCAYVSGPNGTKSLGDPCGPGDVCKSGLLCDGVCRPQCDGPGAACATGSCTRLDDAASGKVIGYVCR